MTASLDELHGLLSVVIDKATILAHELDGTAVDGLLFRCVASLHGVRDSIEFLADMSTPSPTNGGLS